MTNKTNPFEPVKDEAKDDKPKPAAKRHPVIRRSRWAQGEPRGAPRPVPGFTREFGSR
jgi:hypothetical protein